jgi:actin related protein 2/3 complex, subunit 3
MRLFCSLYPNFACFYVDYKYLDKGEDIIDECISLYRMNTFFKSFSMETESDPLLVYGFLYISQILQTLKINMNHAEAIKRMTQLTFEKSATIPGEPAFPLAQYYDALSEREEKNTLSVYLSAFRQELGTRLLVALYWRQGAAAESAQENSPGPSKWWLSFQKRRFLNKSL